MSSVLSVAYTITWNPKEISDGVYLSNNQTLYFHGSGVSIIPDIAESLNLTVETYYGDYFKSLDLVSEGTAEMGSSLVSQDPQLRKDLAYLHPLDSETSDVYFRQPPADSAAHTIIRPFSKRLWLVLIFFMFAVSIISRRRSKQSSLSTICKIFIHAVELLISRHDVHFRLTEVSASIAVARLIVSFFGIIISSVYIGKIASIFVLREDFVKTPNDLIKYNYKLNTYSDIHVHRVFEKSKRKPVTVNVINFTDSSSYIINVIGKRNDDPRQALFSYADGFLPPALYSLNYHQELCSVSVLKSSRKTSRAFYIRKNSPLREDVNLRIVQLIERGLNHRHQVNFKGKFKYSCLKQDTEFNPLTFRYVELAFVPLFVGFILAITSELVLHLMLRLEKTTEQFPKTHLFKTRHKLDVRLYDI